MPSLFLGVFKASYDYEARTEDELTVEEGDMLYLLERSDQDEWWKVKKRILNSNITEPSGLVPMTYIEEAPVKYNARALYDYIKQTQEELTFNENDILTVYDDADENWILVGRGHDEFGFVPANYIEIQSSPTIYSTVTTVSSTLSSLSSQMVEDILPPPPTKDESSKQPSSPPKVHSSSTNTIANSNSEHVYRDKRNDKDKNTPSLTPVQSKILSNATSQQESLTPKNDSIFFSWQVQEVDGRKRNKAILTICGDEIMFYPELSKGQLQKWSIKDLVNYNSEKKHVFLDFKNPHVSLDLRLDNKDVTDEVVHILGELSGAYQASGLTEVILAANLASQKLGKVLYKFEARESDELSVEEGENVFIIDDTKSRDWWMVKNSSGVVGVIPSSYIELIPNENLHKKTQIASSKKKHDYTDTKNSQDSPDQLDRLVPAIPNSLRKTKPDPKNVRTWTDRSGKFKVDATFLRCVDGKIHLHKVNGIKIAVPCNKMSLEDLEYIEDLIGVDLEDDKPLARSLRRQNNPKNGSKNKEPNKHAVIDRNRNEISSPNTKSDYDWFGFFLDCGVDIHSCQRYSNSFSKDKIDESILADVTPSTLRSLGLKEGDIIRVTKKLDEKYDRLLNQNTVSPESNNSGGLFSDYTGALKNNTSKAVNDYKTQSHSIISKELVQNNDDKLLKQPQILVQSNTGSHVPLPRTTYIEKNTQAGSSYDLASIKPLQPTPTISMLNSVQQILTQSKTPQTAFSVPSAQKTNDFMYNHITTSQPLQQSLTGSPSIKTPILTGSSNILMGQQTGIQFGLHSGIHPLANNTLPITQSSILNSKVLNMTRSAPIVSHGNDFSMNLLSASIQNTSISQPIQQQLTEKGTLSIKHQIPSLPLHLQNTGNSLFDTKLNTSQSYATQPSQQYTQQHALSAFSPSMNITPSSAFEQNQNTFIFPATAHSSLITNQPNTSFPQLQQQSYFDNGIQHLPTNTPNSSGIGHHSNIIPVQPSTMQPFLPILSPQTSFNNNTLMQSQPTGLGFSCSYSEQPQNQLQSTATGKRANLALATPSNPFGF